MEYFIQLNRNPVAKIISIGTNSWKANPLP